jgi:hypothetical protein
MSSPRFERPPESGRGDGYRPLDAVSSTVYVTPSAALASREIVAARASLDNPNVLRCLKDHVEHVQAEVSEEGARVGKPIGKPIYSDVEISVLRSPLPAVPARGIRFEADCTLAAPSTRGSSNFYTDSLAFVVGPAIVTLETLGSPHPFPARTERRLLSLLYRRAKADRPTVGSRRRTLAWLPVGAAPHWSDPDGRVLVESETATSRS